MKQFLFFTIIFLLFNAYSQAPEKMSFQAVVRDNNGNVISSEDISIRASILQGSVSGTTVYQETHEVITNTNGLATIEIGSGNVQVGVMGSLNWGNGPYFIKTEIDPEGGTNFTISSTSQLLSVPYALHANKSDTSNYANSASSIDPSARVYIYLKKKSTIQQINSHDAPGTTIINYDTDVDSSGFSFNNATGTIIFQYSGIYTITAHTSFDAWGNPGRKNIWLNCTSSLWPDRIAADELSGDANRITTSFVGAFNAGDQISLSVYQNTGATLDCPSNTLPFDQTFINIERLSPK